MALENLQLPTQNSGTVILSMPIQNLSKNHAWVSNYRQSCISQILLKKNRVVENIIVPRNVSRYRIKQKG